MSDGVVTDPNNVLRRFMESHHTWISCNAQGPNQEVPMVVISTYSYFCPVAFVRCNRSNRFITLPIGNHIVPPL